MIKVFINGRIKYLNEAFLVCELPNYIKAKVLRKHVSSDSFGLQVTEKIFDRDIVTFRTSDSKPCEGVVLRNYQGITSVVECPKYGKRYSLRQVADTVKCIGTALDPNCEEIYARYRDVYHPITSVKVPVKIGVKKFEHIVYESFMIDLATNKLITNINMTDFGCSLNKKVAINMKPGEYGLQFGDFHEYDVVSFKGTDGSVLIGTIKSDIFGSYIECNDDKYPLLRTECKVIGNTLFDDVTTFIEEYQNRVTSSTTNTNEDHKRNDAENDIIYEVFTDGSAASNPGPCGYGYIITQNNKAVRKNSNFLGDGTNNIAELTAIRDALRDAFADMPDEIKLFSDSKYCIDGITKWSQAWIRNGFKTADGEDIANQELWKEVLDLVNTIKATVKISFSWIKGHAENSFNNECDRLAKNVIKAFS